MRRAPSSGRATAPLGSSTLVRSSALRLTVIEGPDRGLSAMVEQLPLQIGRAETADLRLSDATVSQFHAELSLSERGIRVRDLGSRNGTRVGTSYLESGDVTPGSVLHLGGSAVRVELVGQAIALRSAAVSFGGLHGEAPAMQDLYALLERLAPSDLSVLIQGETGTGKELAARAMHEARFSAEAPFVVLDCAALPASLASGLLLGHEKGAFTGAMESRRGIFESAHGGTLFIDEVGELPLELQPVLLRVLQQREVVPLGGSRPRPVEVRVISASWRDLRGMVNSGAFREDLYYRVAKVTVRMPSLSERVEDIPMLVRHFLSRQQRAARAHEITEEALATLKARAYPGNIRELQNTVERLAVLAEGPMITPADLAFERMLAVVRAHPPAVAAPPEVGPFKDEKRTAIEEFERSYLMRLMERTENNLSKAAVVAGLERHNLRELLKRHGLYQARGRGTEA